MFAVKTLVDSFPKGKSSNGNNYTWTRVYPSYMKMEETDHLAVASGAYQRWLECEDTFKLIKGAYQEDLGGIKFDDVDVGYLDYLISLSSAKGNSFYTRKLAEQVIRYAKEEGSSRWNQTVIKPSEKYPGWMYINIGTLIYYQNRKDRDQAEEDTHDIETAQQRQDYNMRKYAGAKFLYTRELAPDDDPSPWRTTGMIVGSTQDLKFKATNLLPIEGKTSDTDNNFKPAPWQIFQFKMMCITKKLSLRYKEHKREEYTCPMLGKVVIPSKISFIINNPDHEDHLKEAFNTSGASVPEHLYKNIITEEYDYVDPKTKIHSKIIEREVPVSFINRHWWSAYLFVSQNLRTVIQQMTEVGSEAFDLEEGVTLTQFIKNYIDKLSDMCPWGKEVDDIPDQKLKTFVKQIVIPMADYCMKQAQRIDNPEPPKKVHLTVDMYMNMLKDFNTTIVVTSEDITRISHEDVVSINNHYKGIRSRVSHY